MRRNPSTVWFVHLLMPACLLAASSALTACGSRGSASEGEDGRTSGLGESTPDDAGTEGGADGGEAGRLDVAGGGEGTAGDSAGGPRCTLNGEEDGVGPCGNRALPDAFDPEVQWAWDGDGLEIHTLNTPMVANFTDDNGDGLINLCDTPDILVNAFSDIMQSHLFLLSGDDGAVHRVFDGSAHGDVNPAVGDLDGDGHVEVVGVAEWRGHFKGRVRVWEHDGSIKWTSEDLYDADYFEVNALGLADLDNDGDVEIYGHGFVLDHDGKVVFNHSMEHVNLRYSATTAADLDGDGDLELIVGPVAFHHDGTEYFRSDELAVQYEPQGAHISAIYPQTANLDGDPAPEILLTNFNGITVLEHDGAVKYADLRPTGDGSIFSAWSRPATIHDFDGDGQAEFAMNSEQFYSVFEANGDVVWQAEVNDRTGFAAGTAFDFLGDGQAEAMFGDEKNLFVYGSQGETLLSVTRSSDTVIEYPVVADVDNDGSAEIVVPSAAYLRPPGGEFHTIRVVRDVEDRWIQARRIWNQHTYHVSNVREDGTIPQFEAPHWERLNTFRTNAQIEGGGVCRPLPAG